MRFPAEKCEDDLSGQFFLLEEHLKALGGLRCVDGEKPTDRMCVKRSSRCKLKAKIVEKFSELALEVERKDRVSDRPSDDAEVLRPRAGWSDAAVVVLELVKPCLDTRAVLIFPTGRFVLEGSPIFISLVVVA